MYPIYIHCLLSVYWCPINLYVYRISGSNTENFNVVLLGMYIDCDCFVICVFASFFVYLFSRRGRKEGFGGMWFKIGLSKVFEHWTSFSCDGLYHHLISTVDFSSLFLCKLVLIKIINANRLAHISLLFIRQHALHQIS